MRRLLVLLTVPILVLLGIVTAPGASANTLNGGTLTNGNSVTATVSVPYQVIQYDFSGTAGVHDTLDVTASNWGGGEARLGVYLPSGEAALFCPVDSTTSFCEFTPHVSGTWKVKLLPIDDATGSVTFTFAADQNRGALTPGTASTSTIAIKGQRAGYTFTGSKGVRNVIEVSATNWGTGTANLNIYQPDGVNAVICPLDSTPTICDFTPPVTGTWRAEIAPDDDSLGTATILLVGEQNEGILSPGIAVSTAIPISGTTASYTFAAVKGVRNVLDVSATNWGAGSAELKLYLPTGELGLSCPIASTSMLCPFIPRVSGSWKVVIDPVGDSAGSVTMTLGADQKKGPLSLAVPVTTAFASRGWQAGYTFKSKARQHLTFDVTATNWGTGSAELDVYQPNGVLAMICPLSTMATFCDFIPPVAGTWKVAVVPTGNSIGSVTMTLAADQNKGPLTPGTSVTATIATKGQRAFYTFIGKAGTKDTIKVTATNWGAEGSANLEIDLPSGEVGLRCPISSTPTTCAFNPHSTGTWKVVVVPVGNALGSVTLNLP